MSDQFEQFGLSVEDAAMLDRLADVGFDLEAIGEMTVDESARATRILSLLGLLDAYPVEDASDTLIDATLARINQHDSQQVSRMHITTNEIEPMTGGFRIRIPDFVSVAAVLLIVISIFFMVGQNVRAQSISDKCASNMAMVGQGLLNFAADHNGAMPTQEAANVASIFGSNNPHRTDPQVLVELGYCDHNHLNCPGHGGDETGFSYQTQSKDLWNNLQRKGRIIILLSDRNPILERMLAGKQFDPLTPSKNHGSLGQNQLQDDGSTKSVQGPPVIGGDKIWILEGNKHAIDIFLTH